jgi:hypothetical protein
MGVIHQPGDGQPEDGSQKMMCALKNTIGITLKLKRFGDCMD